MNSPSITYSRTLKPWAVIQVMQPRHRLVQRFPNRSDADGFLTILQRANPGRHYQIAYEPPVVSSGSNG